MSVLKIGVLLSILPAAISAGVINVTINSSAIAGSQLGVAIDFTTSSPGDVFFCSPTCLKILNFSAPGSTMDLPSSTGGLVQGDLILLDNPAAYTEIEKGSAFNEVIVNLNPVGNLITFTLEYSDAGPLGGFPPDQVSLFLLDSNFQPLFPTDDPLGADALFAIDLTGAPGGVLSLYKPATLQSAGNIAVTIPGPVNPIPEPSTQSMLISAAAFLGLRILWPRLRARRDA